MFKSSSLSGVNQKKADDLRRRNHIANEPTPGEMQDGLKGVKRGHLLVLVNKTGRPEDELVAFDVYWLRDQCPLPGQTQPYKHEKIALLTYRKPGYRPPPGNPPLPPEPKVESAGN